MTKHAPKMPYRYNDMQQAEIDEFLQAPHIAVVGTNRKDGPPQLTPVWYLHRGKFLYFSMYEESAKYRNLSRDPRIGICIAGQCPDARAVMIYGTVEFVAEESDWTNEIHWTIMRRYHDSDEETRLYLDSMPSEGQSTLAIVTPEKIIAQDFN